jgi:DNA-binding transcriptional ArsR family regulator
MASKRAAASTACKVLKVLSNEDRLRILCRLINSSSSVGELEKELEICQPTLSQQLTVLREEGVVATERRGKYIIYSLASPDVIRIMETLYSIYCGAGGNTSGKN